MRSAICVGSRSDWRRVIRVKSARLSFSTTTRPAIPLALARSGDLFRHAPEVTVEEIRIGGILVERRLVRDRLDRRMRATPGDGPRRARDARAGRPSTRSARADPVRPSAAGRRRCGCPRGRAAPGRRRRHPRSCRTGLSRRKSTVSAAPITEKPCGLSRSEAILARNLLCESPMEPVMPSSSRIRRTSRASITAGGAPCSRAVPVRSRKASSSDSGSTAGVRSSIIARIARDDLGIDLHARLHDHRVGAELQRLEHRHGRAHAADARDVAGGRDHAAPPAADDDRLALELGIVALLDGGIEGIAIHVRDGQRPELLVGDHTRRAACGAARTGIEGRQAVAAKGRHDGGLQADADAT